jgi:hypothetical protein
LAVANYVDVHKYYPPAFLTDKQGKPAHSWRVLLLPYIEGNDVYMEYNFDEPWNGPNNSKLSSRMPRVYALHGEERPGNTTTNYLAVVGDETIWQGSRGVKVAAVKDGTSNTILIVENKGAEVHWMEPRDLSFAQMDFTLNSPNGISTRFVEPAVSMADGSVRALTKETTPDILRAMLTVNGGEKLAWEMVEGHGWRPLLDGRQRAVAEQ